MSTVHYYPPLSGGERYRRGLVTLVELVDFMDAYPEKVSEVEQLAELHQIIGQTLLRPIFPDDEDCSGWDLVDLVEDNGPGLTHRDIPLCFLKNVEGTSLRQNFLDEFELSNGRVRLGGFVCLRSAKKIAEEVLDNSSIPYERRIELQWESPKIEDLRRSFPSAEYLIDKIEVRKSGTYFTVQTPRGYDVEISSEFLLSIWRRKLLRF